ncbi:MULTISPECIES: TetR/AcrR family transcriptional regulator [Streptosporangium]|uniref:AcrR family transcriptional regulator n=1 Tax=Streptosporangium brasiliense TaxID=47480 RepID=A0ABT9R5M1_9ACTN|nr:TetR family transcriptional regulator C-terminal domain-containing protein [Streptosporangium brasiliense]MDP9864534.1 AcrR family transcriptional regulator [Streptosporangium brasiliense]
MPKIVDPQERRRAVVEAVFRVVERDGLEQASLRNVAAEAGLAIGSVRHYFTAHSELMVFAMRAMSERVTGRLVAHADRLLDADAPLTPHERRETAIRMLAEVLPLDGERRREAVVWLAFVAAARTRPELRPHTDELYNGLLALTTRVLEGARRAGRLRSDADIALEARGLCALLDGMSLQAVLHPGSLDPETMLMVLRRHLAALTTDHAAATGARNGGTALGHENDPSSRCGDEPATG